MPVLAFGNFTVHGAGSDTPFISNKPAKITFYSTVPVIWGLALLSCIIAIWKHKLIDPAYPVGKVWALVPGYLGLVSVFLIPNDQMMFFAYPPLMVTAVLIAWRWRKAATFIPAFLYAVFAIAALTFLTMSVTMETLVSVPFFLIYSAIIGAVLSIPLCIIRAFVRKSQTWSRIFWALIVGTVAPMIPLILLTTAMGAPLAFFAVPLGFISLATIPFVALIKWNPWVRDVTTGAMFVFPKPINANEFYDQL